MKRLLLLALIFSLAHTPVAFADGPLVASAKRAAQELAQADVQPVNLSDAGPVSVPGRTAGLAATAVRAAAAQGGDSGMSTTTKTWLAIGVGALLAVTFWTIDHDVEDTTLSSLGTRGDGCSFLC